MLFRDIPWKISFQNRPVATRPVHNRPRSQQEAFIADRAGFTNTRPVQPIRPVRPWPYRFSVLTKRFSFKKRARKMLIDIAKSEMTGHCCTPLIHRQPKLDSTTMRRYWILDRRTQTYFEIPMRSVLQYGMSLWSTCYASQRLAVDWYGLLNAITSRQHYDDKGRMLTVLFLTKRKVYLCKMKPINQKTSHFHEDSLE